MGMANKKLVGFVASSDDPEKISKRVRGVVISLSSVIIYVAAQLFNIELTATDIVTLGTQLGIIAGALVTVYGAGIALINKFARR